MPISVGVVSVGFTVTFEERTELIVVGRESVIMTLE